MSVPSGEGGAFDPERQTVLLQYSWCRGKIGSVHPFKRRGGQSRQLPEVASADPQRGFLLWENWTKKSHSSSSGGISKSL